MGISLRIPWVLAVLEGARVVTAWDMLNNLADQARARYAEHLPRLFPYVLAGIREHTRSGKPQEELDAYLQFRLSGIGDAGLNEIDKAISTRVWPELIKNEWRGWRDRTKSTRASNIPVTGKITESQQPGPVTGQQPIQLLAAQQQRPPTGPQLSRPLPAQPQQPVPETPVLPKETGDTLTRPTLSLRSILFPPRKQDKTTDTVIFTTSIRDKKYQFMDRQYQQQRSILVQVLPYWHQAIHDRQAKTRALVFEANTLQKLEE